MFDVFLLIGVFAKEISHRALYLSRLTENKYQGQTLNLYKWTAMIQCLSLKMLIKLS